MDQSITSHDMMQVLILVKYLRQSHEMMKVKHKYLLTMVNNEKDKSKHSQNKITQRKETLTT